MKLRIRTYSGSIYRIDSKALTFTVEKSAASGIRTTEGKLHRMPIITPGQSMILIGPPIDPAYDNRLAITSLVMEVTVEEL